MFCIPETTDWACAYSDEELANMRSDPATAAIMHRSEALAWSTLAALCGYQIGVCPDVIRPCSAGCLASSLTWMQAITNGASYGALPLRTIGRAFTPYVTGGNWVNGCGCSAGSCACTSLESVILPGPVGDIKEVKLDGEVVSPAFYRVDDGNILVNLDPATSWPTCQPADDDPAVGLIVTYYRGAAPNELTNYAAGVLAAEFYKACSAKGKCRLPSGTVSVVRGGTTIELSTETWPGGRTTIREVDAVIEIYNPHHLKGPMRVLSPDVRAARRPTWRTS